MTIDWRKRRGDAALSLFFLALTALLHVLPTGFEERVNAEAVRCRGEILCADDSRVHQYGIVRTGIQGLDVKLLDGPFAGQIVDASNEILGKMEIDKVSSGPATSPSWSCPWTTAASCTPTPRTTTDWTPRRSSSPSSPWP